MSGNPFTIGDVVHLDLEVVTGEEVPVDPGSVVLTVKLPDLTIDTVTSGAITRTGIGLYVSDYPTVQAGRHTARWITTAPSTTKTVEFDTTPDLSTTTPSTPVYANAAQYQQVTGQAPPVDIVRKLAKASTLVDRLLLTALYEVDTSGKPVDTALAAAFAEATCRQVEWETATGDELGLSTVYPRMSIGSVTIDRGQAAAGGGTGVWARAAPLAADVLLSAVDSSGFPLFVGFPIVTG